MFFLFLHTHIGKATAFPCQKKAIYIVFPIYVFHTPRLDFCDWSSIDIYEPAYVVKNATDLSYFTSLNGKTLSLSFLTDRFSINI